MLPVKVFIRELLRGGVLLGQPIGQIDGGSVFCRIRQEVRCLFR